MSWYHIPGNLQDVAVCTEIRLVRNLTDYPFPARMDAGQAKELITRVGGVLEKNGFLPTNPSELSSAAARSLVEKKFMTATFLRQSLPRSLYLNEPCNLSVMVCEEDHLVIRSILSGLALWDGYDGSGKVEALLDEAFPLAFHSRLGYLTASPSLLGTGLRGYVILSLPLLTQKGRMPSFSRRLEQRGIRVTPAAGDRGGCLGGLWVISNRVTLGIPEEELLEGLENAVWELAEEERRERDAASGEERDKLWDRVARAEGIVKHAHLLEMEEAVELLGLLRTGAAMGMTSAIRVENLTALLIEALPATLSVGLDTPPKTPAEQSLIRARLLKERLFGHGEGDMTRRSS